MTKWTFAILAVLIPAAATPTAAAPDPANGIFVDAAGVFETDVTFTGACNGAATLTATIHRPTGDDVRVVDVTSEALPEVCGGGLSCMDCPPVPFPFLWTLSSADGSVSLVGGGTGYYDHYQNWPLAWSLQGDFMEGTLEVHGVLA